MESGQQRTRRPRCLRPGHRSADANHSIRRNLFPGCVQEPGRCGTLEPASTGLTGPSILSVAIDPDEPRRCMLAPLPGGCTGVSMVVASGAGQPWPPDVSVFGPAHNFRPGHYAVYYAARCHCGTLHPLCRYERRAIRRTDSAAPGLAAGRHRALRVGHAAACEIRLSTTQVASGYATWQK